jgi:microcystin-dependent protein
MAVAYLGQILAVGFKIVPAGWLPCDGKLYQVAEYQTLYVLLGTTYGGDGISTFAVPDLRGRIAVHQGQGAGLSDYALGEAAGTETVTLLPSQIGPHTHGLMGTKVNATTDAPYNGVLGVPNAKNFTIYSSKNVADTPLAEYSIERSGGFQPHENRQPFQVINYIICASGIYPSAQ